MNPPKELLNQRPNKGLGTGMIGRLALALGLFTAGLSSQAALAQSDAEALSQSGGSEVVRSALPVTLTVTDLSGSMWRQSTDRTRWDSVSEASSNLVGRWRGAGDVGLTVFGRRSKVSCTDVEQLLPPSRYGASEVDDLMERIAPRGRSPIATALQTAIDAARRYDGPKNIILISDGGDNCGGNVCQTANQAIEDLGNITFHVLGYGLSDPDRAQLACLTELSGGTLKNSNDHQSFMAMQSELAMQIETSINPDRMARLEAERQVAALSEELERTRESQRSLQVQITQAQAAAERAAEQAKNQAAEIEQLSNVSADLKRRLDQTKTALEEAQFRVAEQDRFVEEARAGLELAERERDLAIAAQQSIAANLSETTGLMKDLKAEVAARKEQLNEAEALRASIDSRERALLDDIQRLNLAVDEKQATLNALNSAYEQNSDSDRALIERRAAELATLSNRLAEVESALGQSQSERAQAQSEILAQQSKLEELGGQRDELSTRLARAQEDLSRGLAAEKKATELADDAKSKAQAANQRLDALNEERAVLFATVSDLEQNVGQSAQRITELETELVDTSSARTRWETEARALTADREELAALFTGKLEEVQRLRGQENAEKEEFAAQALQLQGSLADQQIENEELREALKRERERYKDIPTELSDGMKEAKRLVQEAADQASKADLQMRLIVDVNNALALSEQTLIDTEKRYQQMLAERDAAAERLTKERKQIAELQTQAERSLAEASAQIATAQEAAANSVRQIEQTAGEKIQQSEARASAAEAQVAEMAQQLETKLADADQAVSVAKAERSVMQANMRAAIDDANQRVGENVGIVSDLSRLRDSLTDQNEALLAERSRLTVKLEDAERYISSLNSDLASTQLSLESVTLAKDDALETAARRLLELEAAQALLTEREAGLSALSENLQAQSDQSATRQERVAELLSENHQLLAMRDEGLTRIKRLEGQLADADSDRSHIVGQLEEARAKIVDLRGREVALNERFDRLSIQNTKLQQNAQVNLARFDSFNSSTIEKSREIATLSEEVSRERAKQEKLATELERARAEIDRVGLELLAARDATIETQGQNDSLTNEIATLNAALDEAASARQLSMATIATLRDEISFNQTRAAEEKAAAADLSNELQALNQRLREEQDGLRSTMTEQLQAIEQLNASLKQTSNALSAARDRTVQLTSNIEQRDAQIIELSQDRAALDTARLKANRAEQAARLEIETLTSNLNQANQQLSAQADQVAALSSSLGSVETSREQLRQELAEFKVSLASAQRQSAEDTDQLKRLRADLDQRTLALTEAQGQRAEKEKEAREVGLMLLSVKQNLADADQSNLELTEQLSAAQTANAASRETITLQIADNEALARALNDLERSSALKVTAAIQSQAVWETKVAGLSEVIDAQAADITRLDGSLTQALNANASLSAEHDRALVELRETLKVRTAEAEAARASRASAESQMLLARNARQSTAELLAASVKREGERTEQIDALALEISRLNDELAVVSNEKAQTIETNAVNVAKVEALTLSKDQLATDLADASERRDALRARTILLNDIVADLESELTDSTARLKVLETERGDITSALQVRDASVQRAEELEQQLAGANQKSALERDLTARSATERDALSAQLATERTRNNELARQLEAQALQLAEAVEARTELTSQTAEQIDALLRDLTAKTQSHDKLLGDVQLINARNQATSETLLMREKALIDRVQSLEERELELVEGLTATEVAFRDLESRYDSEVERGLSTRQSLEAELRAMRIKAREQRSLIEALNERLQAAGQSIEPSLQEEPASFDLLRRPLISN